MVRPFLTLRVVPAALVDQFRMGEEKGVGWCFQTEKAGVAGRVSSDNSYECLSSTEVFRKLSEFYKKYLFIGFMGCYN